MKSLLNLVRTEPQLFTSAIQALLGVIVAFGVGLTADQTGAILAVSGAILTAVTVTSVRPLQVSAFTGLTTTAAALALSFGAHLPAGGVASVNLLIAAVLGVLTRAQVTPVAKLPKKPAMPSMIPPAPQEPVS